MLHNYIKLLPKFLVLVRCITYNHSKYINDTLKGFVIQETDFPYVCLIMDDASTDGEQEVIKKYLDDNFNMETAVFKEIDEANIIIVRHKKNVNCYFAVYFLKQNLYKQKDKKRALYEPWREGCKYEALCEGDDYWIDARKLQKQVTVLENRFDVSMVYTAFRTVDESNNYIKRPIYDSFIGESHSGDQLCRLMDHNFILTCTCMVRSQLFEDAIYNQAPYLFDYALFLTAANNGNIVYLQDCTACYRQVSTSLTNNNNEQVNNMAFLVRFYFLKLYLFGELRKLNKIEDKQCCDSFWNLVLRDLSKGNKTKYFNEVLKRKGVVVFYYLFRAAFNYIFKH